METKRESVFISMLRVFFKVLGGICGIIVGLFILGFVVAALTRTQSISDKTTPIIGADAQGNHRPLPPSAPAILRINIHGVIGSRNLNSKTVETQLLHSREGMLKNNRVKAVLIHINSPGGLVTDSYNIYKSLIDYKARYHVPIYAFVDGLCASGAMMIACGADKVFSTPVGVIGSVGVRMGPNFNFAKFMETYGINQLTLTEGKDKDALNPFREWGPKEGQSFQDLLAYDYQLFLSIVTAARPNLSRNKLTYEYGARVYDAIKATEYGYIDDGNSSYESVLTQLVKQAGVEGDEKYQVVELKVVHPVLSDLLEGRSPMLSGKLTHELLIDHNLYPELMNRPLYLFSPAPQVVSLD